MRTAAMLAMAGALSMVASAAAQGPLPLTGDLQVNGFTTGDQLAPEAAMADNGTHMVVWSTDLADGDGDGVRFRKFPGDGSAPFVEGSMNQETAGDQIRPAIGMNAASDFVAVWESEVAGEGIRARKSSGSGSTLGAEFLASIDTAVSTQFAAVDRRGDGAFVVVWEQGGDGSFRLFDAVGDPLTDDLEIAPALGESRSPRPALLAGGGFVVAFHAADADGFGVFVQLYDDDGLEVGDALPVPETTAADQKFASVAALPDGGFVVAWEDETLGARVRRFDSDGTPRGAEQAVDFPGSPVAVSVAPGGGFVVASRAAEVRAREFDRLGRPVGDAFTANETTTGSQISPHVAVGADRYVVVWVSSSIDGDGFGIVRRLFRLRSIFADDFESGDDTGWSAP